MKKIEKIFVIILVLRVVISGVLAPQIIKILPLYVPKELDNLMLRNVAGAFGSLLHLFAMICLIIGLFYLFKGKSFKINSLLRFSVYYYTIIYFLTGAINIITMDYERFSSNTNQSDIIFFTDLFVTLLMVIVSSIIFTRKQAINLSQESFIDSNSKGLRVINFMMDVFVISFLVISIRVRIADNMDLVVDNYITNLAVALYYYFYMEFFYSQTIGKFVTKTKVHCDRGSYFRAILIRTIARFIPFEPLSFLSKKKSGWHDRFSNTVLIKITPN